MTLSLVVLISGDGSTFQAISDHIQSHALDAEIKAVISSHTSAYGLERAKSAHIPAIELNYKSYTDRTEFDSALASAINEYTPDYIILAGFMRILTSEFVAQFEGKLLNIHPSLLPKYPGLNTHQRALDAKDQKAGTTIHIVTGELDDGPILMQAEVDIATGDNKDLIEEKVKAKERIIYPLVIEYLANQKITISNNQVLFDKSLIKNQEPYIKR